MALKELHLGISDLNEEDQALFIQEIRLMDQLEHPNIVRSFGVSITQDYSSLVLVLVSSLHPTTRPVLTPKKELMEQGSIKGLLQHQGLTFEVKKNLAIGAALGM